MLKNARQEVTNAMHAIKLIDKKEMIKLAELSMAPTDILKTLNAVITLLEGSDNSCFGHREYTWKQIKNFILADDFGQKIA